MVKRMDETTTIDKSEQIANILRVTRQNGDYEISKRGGVFTVSFGGAGWRKWQGRTFSEAIAKAQQYVIDGEV